MEVLNDSRINGTNTVTAGAVGYAGTVRVQLGNGIGGQVTLPGNGNDSVLVDDGNNDSVSISGDGNDTINMDDGTVTIHDTGSRDAIHRSRWL